MNKVEVNEKEVLKYIKDSLEKVKKDEVIFDSDNYHHNSSYEKSSSILKNGILSLDDQKKLGVVKYTEKMMDVMSDVSSHANGITGISFSKVGLTDLYKDELEYNPYFPHVIDFIVSKELKTRRYSVNYGNEFISDTQVPREMIKSVDTRILELLDKEENKDVIVSKYNTLIELAGLIKELNIDVTLRDTSNNQNNSLDIDELSTLPQIQVK